MGFLSTIKEELIKEWSDFYINYNYLMEILDPLRKNFKSDIKFVDSNNYSQPRFGNNHHIPKEKKNSSYLLINAVNNSENNLKEPLLENSEESKEISSQNDEDENENKRKTQLFQQTKKNFFEQLNLEVLKFRYFAKKMYNERHIIRFNEIIDQLSFIRQNKEYKIFNDQLENSLKNFYRDICTFRTFISTNQKIKDKIISKYSKYTTAIEPFTDFNDIYRNVNFMIKEMKNLNRNLIKETERKFADFFHEKYNMHPLQVLKDFLQNETFTPTESFNLGVVIGLMFLLLFAILVLGYNKNLDFDNDPEFKSVFPIYRTFGILILYLWTLGLNVWAWNRANINYKALFAFDNHYSTVSQICSRAAFFTIMLFLCLLTYFLMRSRIQMFLFLDRYFSVAILPLICWLSLIVYFFAPMKIWNYKGRVYTMKLFMESVASIFIPTQFRHVWFMDQLTSLIGPMRDIEFTICYYSYYTSPIAVKEQFCSNRRGVYLLIAIFPNMLRILQVIRIIYDSKKVFPNVFNIGKYSFNIIVATFSFLTNFYPKCFTLWLITAFISGCYSSVWDVKKDFGFFEWGPNFPLRNRLTYKNYFFYYFAIINDIILRFLWVLSISPEIMSQIIRPEFLALILYTLEMFRRGMWNFIRVEYEHLDMLKKFIISYPDELPFIQSGDQFIVSVDNLLNILNNEKADQIKVEYHQLFMEINKNEFTRNNDMEKFISEDLENFLQKYKETSKNKSGILVKRLSRSTIN